MIQRFLIILFWDFHGKYTRIDAERMAKCRVSMMKESPAIVAKNRIEKRWFDAEMERGIEFR